MGYYKKDSSKEELLSAAAVYATPSCVVKQLDRGVESY